MKTQNYILIVAALIFNLNLACSNHPEIKPYEAESPQELAVNENAAKDEDIDLPDSADGFVEDAELPAETEKPVEIAKVEEPKPVETKKVEAKKTPSKRVPASAMKSGYFVFSESCDMKSSPKEKSQSVGSVSKGKKLWLDVHNSGWLKAYKKKGTAYVSADCVK